MVGTLTARRPRFLIIAYLRYFDKPLNRNTCQAIGMFVVVVILYTVTWHVAVA